MKVNSKTFSDFDVTRLQPGGNTRQTFGKVSQGASQVQGGNDKLDYSSLLVPLESRTHT